MKMAKMLAHKSENDECREGNWCSMTKEKAQVRTRILSLSLSLPPLSETPRYTHSLCIERLRERVCIGASPRDTLIRSYAHTHATLIRSCACLNICEEQEVINMLDSDGNGGISYSEVLNFIALDAAFRQCSSEHKHIGPALDAFETACAVSATLSYLDLDAGTRGHMSNKELQDIVALRGADGVLDLAQFCSVFNIIILPNATPLNANRRFNRYRMSRFFERATVCW
jgi:hypothetical protein